MLFFLSRLCGATLEKTMERIVRRAGTNTVHEVMITHGFRKFAITQMAKAKVDFSDREYLVMWVFGRPPDFLGFFSLTGHFLHFFG